MLGARYTRTQIKRALRSSIGKDSQALSLDLHSAYRWMSDYDATAIAVYLLSLPPASSPVERRVLGGFQRRSWGIFSQHREVAGYVPALPERPIPQYGRYLARSVAACAFCHTAEDTSWFSSPEAYAGDPKNQPKLPGSFR